MRVIAGEMKGRRLVASHGAGLRPTSAKVRESVFNILGDRIKDAVFIDLYAGTGAVGIEAMSRGAQTVYFVEASRKSAEAIEETLRGCGCRQRAKIINKKASDFVKGSLIEAKADIIFLDPPYHTGEMDEILPLLSDGRLLGDGGVVLAERLSKKRLPEEIGALRLKKSYRYGDTALSLYEVRG